MLVGIGKIGGAGLQVHLVRRPRYIPDHQLLAWVGLLQKRFQMPELMHAIEQSVADQTDAGPRIQLERQLRLDGFGGLGAFRRLLEHGVFPELVVLGKGEQGSDEGRKCRRRQNKVF